jgi:hypothetical protein
MEDVITVIKGTELKLLFTATQGDNNEDVDLINSPFKITYYTDGETKLSCSDQPEEGGLSYKQYDGTSNQLLIRVPTKDLNPGMLKCEAIIYVEDDDFSQDLESPIGNTDMDGLRKEILRESTRIKIIQ